MSDQTKLRNMLRMVEGLKTEITRGFTDHPWSTAAQQMRSARECLAQLYVDIERLANRKRCR